MLEVVVLRYPCSNENVPSARSVRVDRRSCGVLAFRGLRYTCSNNFLLVGHKDTQTQGAKVEKSVHIYSVHIYSGRVYSVHVHLCHVSLAYLPGSWALIACSLAQTFSMCNYDAMFSPILEVSNLQQKLRFRQVSMVMVASQENLPRETETVAHLHLCF